MPWDDGGSSRPDPLVWAEAHMRALAAERDSYRTLALAALDQLHQQTVTIAALREDLQRMTSPVTPARTCRHCGEPFTPAYELQAFCRPSCRQSALCAEVPPSTAPTRRSGNGARAGVRGPRAPAPYHRARTRAEPMMVTGQPRYPRRQFASETAA